MLVKYSREHSENQRYVEIAEFLAAHGVRAPKIHFHDPEEGLIWIEDLGDHDLWSYRDESWLGARRLLRVGARGNREAASRLSRRLRRDSAPPAGAVRRRALSLGAALLFRTLPRSPFRRRRRRNCEGWRNCRPYPEIAERLASFPRVLVHRDFQSQNIILRNGQAYLIDFQGMRPGLAEYDLASLLHDPYVRLTEAERAGLLEFYRATAE